MAAGTNAPVQIDATRAPRSAARRMARKTDAGTGRLTSLMPGSGSELYRGLGAVVVGGLVVSTIFTLVLVPVLLGWAMRWRERSATTTAAAS